MKIKLKEDYVIPAGTEMLVATGVGPINREVAVRDIEVGEIYVNTYFDMRSVKGHPELFEIIDN